MTSTAKKILEQANAYLILEEIQLALHQEQQMRQEFYKNVSENQKTEFINGKVVLHSPVMKRHNESTNLLNILLTTYVNKHSLGFVGIEKIMISLTRNDYEPDICFFKSEKAQNFTEDQMLFPTPDLVVEVLSKSTEKNDRTVKFEDYEAHGITEYWIIDPKNLTIEQYHLQNNQYKLLFKSNQGNIKSQVISSFEIPIEAIFDKAKNAEALGEILSNNI